MAPIDTPAKSEAPAKIEKPGTESQVRDPLAGASRYPVELIDVLVLRDGWRVTIRPILPQDDAVTNAFFRNLSAPSRYNRFMQAFHDVPEALLRQLTHVDYHVHLALIAEIFIGGREVAIGEARYVAGSDGGSAEFAVSIADAWQGRGLGTFLLSKLIAAAGKAGIIAVTGETLASNTAMLHLARRAGFTCEADGEIAGLMHLCLNIAGERCYARMAG